MWIGPSWDQAAGINPGRSKLSPRNERKKRVTLRKKEGGLI